MNRQYRTGIFVLILAMALSVCVTETAEAGRKILFVAPVRPTVIRALQDVVRRHPGHVLVSYQPGTPPEETTLLHAWVEDAWVRISMDEYSRGRFVTTRPDRALLFGPDHMLPEQLVAATNWVPLVLSVAELDTPSVLNAVGRLLAFHASEWRWFAQRYDLHLTDANEPLRAETWYDQPHEPRRFEPPPIPTPPRRRRAAAREEPAREKPERPPRMERTPTPPPAVDEEPPTPPLPVPAPAAPEPAARGAGKGPAPRPAIK